MRPVAIITINYFSTSLIRRLEAIVDGQPEFQLYVVDNSGDFISPYASTRIIRSGANVGFARACNLAARTCDEPLLFFLNPDLEVELPDLKALAAVPHTKTRSIWGALIDTGNQIATAVVPRAGKLLLFRRVAFPLDRAAEHKSVFISGACLCAARELFLGLGGFDERIFMYGEDLDLCLRAAKQGVEIVTCNDIKIRHFSGTASQIKWPLLLRLIRWPTLKRISWSIRGHYLFLSSRHPWVASLTTAIYLATRGGKAVN